MSNPVDTLNWEEYKIPEKWNWKAAVPSWTWHKIVLNDYDNWDMVGKAPPFVRIEITRTGEDEDVESYLIANQFDSKATGLFYYRDWTNSGLPFVEAAKIYWSGFWFQKIADAVKFHEQYGGIASWQHDFEKKIAEAKL